MLRVTSISLVTLLAAAVLACTGNREEGAQIGDSSEPIDAASTSAATGDAEETPRRYEGAQIVVRDPQGELRSFPDFEAAENFRKTGSSSSKTGSFEFEAYLAGIFPTKTTVGASASSEEVSPDCERLQRAWIRAYEDARRAKDVVMTCLAQHPDDWTQCNTAYRVYQVEVHDWAKADSELKLAGCPRPNVN